MVKESEGSSELAWLERLGDHKRSLRHAYRTWAGTLVPRHTGMQMYTYTMCTCAHTHSPRAVLTCPAASSSSPRPPLPHTPKGPIAKDQPPGTPPAGPTAEQPGHPHAVSTATLFSPPPYPVSGTQNLGPESPALLGLAWLSPAQLGSAQALPAKFAGELRCRGGTSWRRCQMQQGKGQAALGNQAQASRCHENVTK